MIIMTVNINLSYSHFNYCRYGSKRVNVIRGEQLGLQTKKTVVTMKMLQRLYNNEWCFDTGLLFQLYCYIKTLVMKYASVRNIVFDVIESLEEQKKTDASIVMDSHVFLVPYIQKHVPEREITTLRSAVDEINLMSL